MLFWYRDRIALKNCCMPYQNTTAYNQFQYIVLHYLTIKLNNFTYSKVSLVYCF